MAARTELVEKLVSTLHLNVAERHALGSVPISKSEVISAVLRSLERDNRFPPNARPWQQGEVVFEGHFLEVLADGGVRLWCQRSHPINPTQLAERKRWDFEDGKRAVEQFVAREWPDSQIDGIPIAAG